MLRYDEARWQDEYGGLADQPLDLNELAEFEISAATFEEAWERAGSAGP